MTRLAAGEYDVLLNGVQIHYSIRGKGPLLIAHSGGPGADARDWDDFAGIDDFVTLIVLHPRGSGLSGPAPADAYLLPDYASDVEALRIHLGLEKPMLMGWSHGGMVAMQYACTFPDCLSRLILFDTTAYFGEFLSDVEASVQAFRNEPWFDDALEALKREWAGDYQTDEDMARLWQREKKFYFRSFDARAQAYADKTKNSLIKVAPLRVFNEQEAPTFDLRPQLGGIKVPTLVIVGRHDFITNTAMAQEMVKHIPNARLEIFEESGHFAFVEEPGKFKQVIREFTIEEKD